ncbi:hypothetical protein ACOBR2_06695 [Telmatobacter bradus]|uniref:hypothetical protein n=1 Tax=Telmatobacter bradus TaxID=474953 RepID=UPI003B42C175
MARYDLGMSEREFWRSTPNMLRHLKNRLREQQRFQQFQTALLCATVVNFSMGRPKTPVRPADFMPDSRCSGALADAASSAIQTSDQVSEEKRAAIAAAFRKIWSLPPAEPEEEVKGG